MYYKGDQMVKKLYYGTQEIKAVYIGEKKIYPNVTGQQTGSDPTPWTYDLPKRTRTVTPWTQDVYADGSLGDKVYGPEEPQTETATVSESKGIWSYTTTTSSSTRTRVVNNVYTFSDEVKTAFKNNETETGERSQGSWTYDWANSKRTATVTYKYSDATETIPLTETGTVTYNFTITPADTTAIAAGGGSKSISATGNIDKKWNNVVAASTTATVTSIKFSGTIPTGFTISGRNVNAANRGTTEGAILTASVCGVATVDNKSLNSTTISVNQAENMCKVSGSYYLGKYISQPDTPPQDKYIPVSGNGELLILPLNNINFNLTYSSGSIIKVDTNTYKPTLSATHYTNRIIGSIKVIDNSAYIDCLSMAGRFSGFVTESFRAFVSLTYNSQTYTLVGHFVIQGEEGRP